mmetsp:Transcript_23325/g.41789  ORF Transcript_23325/g.41789 Transcript_23325/m.41789 type:complete len:740 (-) Transcript_23325:418-2637(-)|eukprot:CAMPEP_0201653346 /NCGR_PEP_ID=MMETSP0493-20130528/44938_1 /ASSEMBLY_ACC=CAM_ASM_000838 /TAXON_ID=420259 /ORGANISM="Thalassiosira gravida, Strain GMp14c1" /LENGTH=739 /DNA_ID=CAMNT_0048129877 /DNA_START=55 /DNA_END=2274 /DNA_ORIENTATION=+
MSFEQYLNNTSRPYSQSEDDVLSLFEMAGDRNNNIGGTKNAINTSKSSNHRHSGGGDGSAEHDRNVTRSPPSQHNRVKKKIATSAGSSSAKEQQRDPPGDRGKSSLAGKSSNRGSSSLNNSMRSANKNNATVHHRDPTGTGQSDYRRRKSSQYESRPTTEATDDMGSRNSVACDTMDDSIRTKKTNNHGSNKTQVVTDKYQAVYEAMLKEVQIDENDRDWIGSGKGNGADYGKRHLGDYSSSRPSVAEARSPAAAADLLPPPRSHHSKYDRRNSSRSRNGGGSSRDTRGPSIDSSNRSCAISHDTRRSSIDRSSRSRGSSRSSRDTRRSSAASISNDYDYGLSLDGSNRRDATDNNPVGTISTKRKNGKGLFGKIKNFAGMVKTKCLPGGVHKYKPGEMARYRPRKISKSLKSYVDPHTQTVQVWIIAVHIDAVMEIPYYTIGLPDETTKQTNWDTLIPLSEYVRSSTAAAGQQRQENNRSVSRSRSIASSCGDSQQSGAQRSRSGSQCSGRRSSWRELAEELDRSASRNGSRRRGQQSPARERDEEVERSAPQRRGQQSPATGRDNEAVGEQGLFRGRSSGSSHRGRGFSSWGHESDRSLGAASRSSRFSGSGASSRKSVGFDSSGSISRDSSGGGRRRRPRSPSPVGLDRGGMPDRGVSRSSGKSRSSKSKPPPVTVRSSHHPNNSDSTLLQSSSSRSGRPPPQDQHRRSWKSLNKYTQSSLTNSTHASSSPGELWF